MDLTREEAITKFREHWLWLSEHPEANKNEAPIIKKENPRYYCFLCHYALTENEIGFNHVDCSKCPIEWPSESKIFMCENNIKEFSDHKGLWLQWRDAHDKKDHPTASALALQIANLPERVDMSEVEEILKREG